MPIDKYLKTLDSSGWTKVIIGVVVVSFLVIGIYYLIKYLAGKKESEKFEYIEGAEYPQYVFIHKKGCPPCINMAGDWRGASQELHAFGINCLDVEVGTAEAEKYMRNIKGTPTIRWYYSPEHYDEYEGDRTRDSLVLFAKDRLKR